MPPANPADQYSRATRALCLPTSSCSFSALPRHCALLPSLAWALALISGRKINRIAARGSAHGSAAPSCCCRRWLLSGARHLAASQWHRRRRSAIMILRFPALFVGAYPTGTFAMVLGAIIAVPAAWLMMFAAGLIGTLPHRSRKSAVPAASDNRGARPGPVHAPTMRTTKRYSPTGRRARRARHMPGTRARPGSAACSA